MKLHGDLINKNFVLKEEDYLNYSDNFKLIETLAKSIFSTNTVVFIGYLIEEAVNNLMNYYDFAIKHSTNNIDVISLQRQIKTCLVLLRYVRVSQELVDKIWLFTFFVGLQ